MSLTVKTERPEPGKVRIRLSGNIDERARIPETLAAIQEDATLNLAGIEHVNSIGLLSWLKAIGVLTAKHRITIEALSYRLSIQANNVLDLFGKARVVSCMAPYFCPACNQNREVEVTGQELLALGKGVPSRQCPNCKKPMEFDEMEEYFTFLREDAEAAAAAAST